MRANIPLTPDILNYLKPSSQYATSRRQTESTQFLLFLVVVTALLLSTLPLLINQTNHIFGTSNPHQIIPVLNPTPTPDSSLLFYIHQQQ